MSPAVEKTLSEGTLVAGMVRYIFATRESRGKQMTKWSRCAEFLEVEATFCFSLPGIVFSRLTGPWKPAPVYRTATPRTGFVPVHGNTVHPY